MPALPFNNYLCNRYEAGTNAMGFHFRLVRWPGRDEPDRDRIVRLDKVHRTEVVLEHGSMLLMPRATQLAWKHALPPASAAGLRIRATFRQIVTDVTSVLGAM